MDISESYGDKLEALCKKYGCDYRGLHIKYLQDKLEQDDEREFLLTYHSYNETLIAGLQLIVDHARVWHRNKLD